MRTCFSPFRLLPLAAALAATSAMALTTMTSPSPARATAPATTGTTTTGTTTAGGTTTGTTTTTTTSTTTSGSPTTASTVIPTQITPASRTASGGTTTEQTSGTSIAGTSTGDAFSGSSRGDAPVVGAAALANGNAFATTNQPGVANGVALTGPTGVPIVVDNATAAQGTVALNGERIAMPAGSLADVNLGFAGAAVVPQVGMVTSNPAATTPAERKELRKRQNLPRNGQLLYSIAPRTNVDRSWQLRDDPISPALRPPA